MLFRELDGGCLLLLFRFCREAMMRPILKVAKERPTRDIPRKFPPSFLVVEDMIDENQGTDLLSFLEKFQGFSHRVVVGAGHGRRCLG